MHDPQHAEAVLFLVTQSVVSGVGVGEFGFAAPFGDLHSRKNGGFLGVLVIDGGATVDMPVKRRPEVVRRGVLRFVQRDGVDAGHGVVAVGRVIDLSEAATEGDLGLRFDPQPPKDQNPVVLQRIQYGLAGRVIGAQVHRIQPSDFGADGLAELADGEQTHSLSFLFWSGGCQGYGSSVRIMTASAASVGTVWCMISTDMATKISE